MLVCRFADRVGKGLRTAPRDALLTLSVDAEQRGLAFGFHRAMDNFGAVIGPLIAAGLLALGMPLRQVLLCAIVPAIVVIWLAFAVREPEREAELDAHAFQLEPARVPARISSLPPRARRCSCSAIRRTCFCCCEQANLD